MTEQKGGDITQGREPCKNGAFICQCRKTVEIGKTQMVSFEEGWPTGFNTTIPKQIVTLDIA